MILTKTQARLIEWADTWPGIPNAKLNTNARRCVLLMAAQGMITDHRFQGNWHFRTTHAGHLIALSLQKQKAAQ